MRAASMQPLTQVALMLLSSVASGATYNTRPTAVLDSGHIFGVQTELPNAPYPVNKFLGIPYAKRPERFAPPEPPEPWSHALNTSGFRPACIQYIPSSPGLLPGADIFKDVFGLEVPESEDCLYMNAFAPASEGPREGRPVVLVIHGGGWQLGHGNFDLSGFAAYEDLVCFSFSYRTNIFGFPNSPDIPVENRNLGLLDQQRALAWVQANAAAFGGDPSKVTIFGESAGAASVDAHVHAYAAADPPPFHAAAMFSGQFSWGLFGVTTNPADVADWNNVTETLGCANASSTLACMRDAEPKQLVDAMAEAGAAFTPMKDNVTMTDHRAEAWREGNIVKVPVLTGTIAEEGRSLIDRNVDLDLFVSAYMAESLISPGLRDKIFAYYRAKPHINTDFDLAAAIFTDFLIQCPRALLAEASASIDNPTWQFYFNISITNLLPDGFDWLGKFHGSDIALLFLQPSYENLGPPLTAVQYTFATYFRDAIGKFVRNPQGGPGWPAAKSGAYEPFDIASLGDVGDVATGGATPTNRTALDEACSFYQDAYTTLERFVL